MPNSVRAMRNNLRLKQTGKVGEITNFQNRKTTSTTERNVIFSEFCSMILFLQTVRLHQ